jgi:hypothetical protein
MMLGQAAGNAAALAQKDKSTVQEVKGAELQKRLRGATVPFKKP